MFKVKVEYETVIHAENEEKLRQYIKTYIREMDDQDYRDVEVREIKDLSDLPNRWYGQCLPWGERDPYDRTIEEILKDVKD